MSLGKYWATSVIHAKPAVTSMCKDDFLKRFSRLFVRAIKKAWGVEHLLSLRMFQVNKCLDFTSVAPLKKPCVVTHAGDVQPIEGEAE